MSSDPGQGGPRPKRLSRPALFMAIAHLFGQRSSCPRAEVGAVAVKDGRIIATGYVGAPSGQAHCNEIGCKMEAGHCVRTIHAEANLVAWAARVGTPLVGAILYCTHSPCLKCAQLIANAGISELHYHQTYNLYAVRTLREFGVTPVHESQ